MTQPWKGHDPQFLPLMFAARQLFGPNFQILQITNKHNVMSSSTTLLGGLPETKPHRHRRGWLLGGEGDCQCFIVVLFLVFELRHIALPTCSPQWLILTKASSSAIAGARREMCKVEMT